MSRKFNQKITRVSAFIALIAGMLILLSGMNISWTEEITLTASAANPLDPDKVRMEINTDHARILDSQPFFEDCFTNESGLTTVWDVVSTTGVDFYLDLGYMTMIADDETHSTTENLTLTQDSVLFEMMYMANTKHAGDEGWLKVENLTDISFVQAGNDYNAFEIKYSNTTGSTITVNPAGIVFEEDVWYIVQIYVNSNSTCDVEFRYKENFTLIPGGHTHITATNITAPSAVSALYVNVTNVAGINQYDFEYAFGHGNTNEGVGPTSGSAAFKGLLPEKSGFDNTWRKRTIDQDEILDNLGRDLNESWANQTGGTNVSTAIDLMSDLPADLDTMTANHTDESYWTATQISDATQLTSERNESAENPKVRTVHVYDFTPEKESLMEEIEYGYLQQFNDADDDDDDPNGYIVSARITSMLIYAPFDADLADQTRENFWEGMKGGNADIETFSWPWNDIGDGIKGTGAEFQDAIGDGINSATSGGFGFFGLAGESGASIVSSSFGGFSQSVTEAWDDGWSMTNAALGSLLDGDNLLIFSPAALLANGWFDGGSGPLSLFFGGTISMLMKVILVLGIVLIVGIIIVYRVWPANGKPSDPMKHGPKRSMS